MHKLLFKILILFSFCQGLLFYIGFEGIIYKFFVLALTYGVFISFVPLKTNVLAKDKFFLFFIFYLIIILISSFINQSSYKDTLSYSAFIIPAFVVYVFINKVFHYEYEIFKINRLFFYIFIFQILFSIFKLFYWGTSEAIVGTIHYSGGSLNTIVPLIGISMAISFWLIYDRNYKFILIIVGFLFMAWIGEKRGVYFYFFILMLITYFSYSSLKGILSIRKILIFVFLLIPLSFGVIYVGAKYSPTLNPENMYGGSFDINYIYNYITEYNTQIDQIGYAGGRYSGMKAVFNAMINKLPLEILFGQGPGTLLGASDESYKIYTRYNLSSMIGVNGWSAALISIGFMGAVIATILYSYITRLSFLFCKKEKDNYWQAIGFGTFLISIVFFMDFFTYTRSFYHSIPLNITLFYFYSIIKIRYNQNYLE